jgi:hexosaminidase
MPAVGLPAGRPDEKFGMVCRGFLTIPADGVYTLGLRSDDGSRLFVGGALAIDNDGTHDKQERRAELALAAGRHAIRVEYFQWSYGATLELWLGGPQRAYAQVPPELL